jgi:hypothetical protein
MSFGVSQIEYWREVNKPDKTKNSNIFNTKDGGPGATYLSYDVFLGLSIIGGLLALDHLYLRSPLTFIAKIIVNVLTLGSWWIYDASQAVFNRDVVKVFGLGVPGLGPKGIAAGVLASEVPGKKHMTFFMYALALMLGGIFGLDSFIVGDKQSGFIRLICLITGLLAPVAIFWWLYNLGKFFFKTKDVTSQYWEYFGAPPPAEYNMTLGEKIVTKIPFLQTIFGPIKRVKNAIGTTEGLISKVETLAEAVSQDPVKTFEEVIAKPLYELKPAIEPIIEAAAPLKETLNAGIATAQTGLEVVQDGLVLGKTALNTGKEIADKTLNVVGKTAEAATQALTLAPSAATLSTGLTTMAAQQALNKLNQQGGGVTSNILSYTMMGTLAIIIVSGLVLTYRRFRQNEQPRKDDNPPSPEPRVLRKSDQEKSP